MKSDIIEADRQALEKSLDSALTDEKLKRLKKDLDKLAYTITEDIMYSVQSDMATNLSYHVSEMVERVINALLAGNHSEMQRWLSCGPNSYQGRSHDQTNRTLENQHPIIHGVLHENSMVALRKKIFDAHRDLIVNERILDLEDQVKSLVAQVNKVNNEKYELIEKYRGS